jgi:hypothetical protein
VSAGTRNRNVRVPNARWEPALAKATAEGSDLAKVINTLIDGYLRMPAPPEGVGVEEWVRAWFIK